MKLKIYVIDLEIPKRVKTWSIRLGILAGLLGSAAVALAAPLHVWATGDTLQAADLNEAFANLQAQISAGWVVASDVLHNNNPNGRVGIGTATPSVALDVNGAMIRKIARAHGNGPNDGTVNGAIPSRLLAYTKTQAATGLRVTWQDNLRCLGGPVSCEWELKIDGASCPAPGPLSTTSTSTRGATCIARRRMSELASGSRLVRTRFSCM